VALSAIGWMLSAPPALAHQIHVFAAVDADDTAAATLDSRGLEAVHAQLVELRKQLNQHEQSLRLRDILGGIGYIVGIAGVAFYFLGIRRKRLKSSE
jgi:nickel transport protein